MLPTIFPPLADCAWLVKAMPTKAKRLTNFFMTTLFCFGVLKLQDCYSLIIAIMLINYYFTKAGIFVLHSTVFYIMNGKIKE
jgi:hypothetical protein